MCDDVVVVHAGLSLLGDRGVDVIVSPRALLVQKLYVVNKSVKSLYLLFTYWQRAPTARWGGCRGCVRPTTVVPPGNCKVDVVPPGTPQG